MSLSLSPLPDTISKPRDPAVDSDWADLQPYWRIREGTTYLNHGSFGPPNELVRQTRREYIDALDCQPMDFYLRTFEPALATVKQKLAAFVGTDIASLVFVENATFGMNVVANSFPVQAGDEIVFTNHEYGAVRKIWDRVAKRVGAKCVEARLPEKLTEQGEVLDAILSVCSERTKMVVVSHVTSATALVLPVIEICQALRNRGIAICIDGPHAPAQVELDIQSLGCDFYTASCHKWLNASLGTGFLFADAKWHHGMQPVLQSWGRLSPAVPEHWTEEFIWSGTRDPSGYLSLGAAIDFINAIGVDSFQQRTRWLAAWGEQKLVARFGLSTNARRQDGWYGSMAHVPLPPGDHSGLQSELWKRHQIEIPMFPFEGKDYIRLSCHLYNDTEQLERLDAALGELT